MLQNLGVAIGGVGSTSNFLWTNMHWVRWLKLQMNGLLYGLNSSQTAGNSIGLIKSAIASQSERTHYMAAGLHPADLDIIIWQPQPPDDLLAVLVKSSPS